MVGASNSIDLIHSGKLSVVWFGLVVVEVVVRLLQPTVEVLRAARVGLPT